MVRSTRSELGPAAVLLLGGLMLGGLLLGCAGAATPLPGSTAAVPGFTAAASVTVIDPSASDSPAPWLFTGTSDDVVAEVTNAGLTCDQSQPAKGFELQNCGVGSGSSRQFVDVYSRHNGDLVGVDMTFVSTGPVDPNAVMTFVAVGLGGAMGPDSFNAVSAEVSARLDGSSPAPVWVSPDLRLTVRVVGNSAYVTILAPDLAAVWGS